MIDNNKKDAKTRMDKAVEVLKNELAKLRTGRAHPSLVDHVRVSNYGSMVPLSQVASINIEDARTLIVNVWDKSAIVDVERALRTSDLGLNPVVAGQVIRLPLPPLTEERRKDLVKVLKAEGETAKVAVRNVRRDANTHLKQFLKDKSVSEDDTRRAEEEIQKMTDKCVVEIDKLLEAKEKELMAV